MMQPMTGTKRVLLWIVGIVIAIVLGLAAHEVAIFITSDEAAAREKAEKEFIGECARSGLKPNEFSGPQRIKSPGKTYGFVWTNSSNGDQVATMVRFFPAGVEAWLIRGSPDGKFELYCDKKDRSCN
jgi:hypothetical protein